MMRFYTLLAGLLLACNATFGQISFQKNYTSNTWDEPEAVIETAEGYLIAGNSREPILNRMDALLLMIGHEGQILWQKSYGTFNGNERFIDVIHANDGGYVALGIVRDPVVNINRNSMMLVHTNAQGTLLWSKVITGADYQTAQKIIAVPGGYVISGEKSPTQNYYSGTITYVDNNGNTVWSKYFESGESTLMIASHAENNRLFVHGHTDYFVTLLQLDLTTGDLLQKKVFGNGYDYATFTSFDTTLDNNFIYGGKSGEYSTSWIYKTDKQGNPLWSKSYYHLRGPQYSEVETATDGGYLLMPNLFTWSDSTRPILTKLDGNGDIEWSYEYGTKNQRFLDAIPVSDGGFLAVGKHLDPASTDGQDILVVKTLPNGLVDGCCTDPYPFEVADYSLPPGNQPLIPINFYTSQPLSLDQISYPFNATDFCAYEAPVRAISVAICPGTSITINGAAYETAGVVLDTISMPGSCDSVLQYNITVLPPVTATREATICAGDTLWLNNLPYSSPDTVSFYVPALTGCDTLETWHITLYAPDTPSVASLTCPAPVVVASAPGADFAMATYTIPTFYSDCYCAGGVAELQQGLASGSAFPVGETLVCYAAADRCGGSTSCCFTVTVQKTELPYDPCDVKNIGCMTYELLSIDADLSGNRRYEIAVTNHCNTNITYVALMTPPGVVALAPANNSFFLSGNNHTYLVRNPSQTPFNSVRFTRQDGTLTNGASDVFDYTLPAQAAAPVFIRVLTRLDNGAHYDTYLNTFGCPVGTADREAGADQSANRLVVYPNPVSGRLYVDWAAWGHVPTSVRLLDPRGQLVPTALYEEGSTLWMLDVGERVPGVYFLEVRSTDGAVEVMAVMVL
jgi:HYR domain